MRVVFTAYPALGCILARSGRTSVFRSPDATTRTAARQVTVITSLPFTVSSPAIYVLDRDLTVNGSDAIDVSDIADKLGELCAVHSGLSRLGSSSSYRLAPLCSWLDGFLSDEANVSDVTKKRPVRTPLTGFRLQCIRKCLTNLTRRRERVCATVHNS